MLGCTVGGYIKACTPVTGGIDQLLLGDANDFDWVSAAPVAGDPGGYASVARHTGATHAGGADLFEVDSIVDQLGIDITQANADGSSSSYEYLITARLAQMSQQLTNFNAKLDAAALCCQLVFVWRMNDGKIFVIGEKYVDALAITRFRFRQDGSKISTGKKFTDFNGEDLSIKGSYSRKPYEFTGTWADILLMQV